MRGNRDVARDEQGRRPFFAHEPPQEFQHLRLNGDVKTACGVVGNHQLGRANQRHGDGHPLRHAATEFMRVGAKAVLRVGNAHRAQDLERQPIALGAADPQMIVRDVRNLPADRNDRIELGARIGDHHGKLATQHGAARPVIELAQVAPVEQHLPAFDHAG